MNSDAEPKLTSFNVNDDLKHLSCEEIKEIADSRRLPFAVALANITGDLNTGIIIRSACVLGAKEAFVFGRRKYDRRSTVGAHHYIDITHYEAFDGDHLFDWAIAMHTIRIHGYTPVVVEQGGNPLQHLDPFKVTLPLCLVFGAEDTGIPEHICASELWYSIPQPGVVRSLNVSSAASIAMWHVSSHLMPFI